MGQKSTEEIIYIGFNENSSSTFISEGEMGTKTKLKSYLKNISSQGLISFYIEGLLFVHEPVKMESTSPEDIAKFEFRILSPAEISRYIEQIKEIYPMGYKFGSKEFPRLVIVDKSAGNLYLYEVKWQPYIN